MCPLRIVWDDLMMTCLGKGIPHTTILGADYVN